MAIPTELLTGRDIELLAVGSLSIVGAGVWIVLPDESPDWVFLGLLVFLGGLSFLLVWIDLRMRTNEPD